jgi:hypothetical protein
MCRYAQVLRENPGCPAEVRLGLAACLYRGGKLERASTAYKRCVDARPWYHLHVLPRLWAPHTGNRSSAEFNIKITCYLPGATH